MSTVQQNQTTQSLAFVSGRKAMEKERDVSSALLSSLTQELEGLLGDGGINHLEALSQEPNGLKNVHDSLQKLSDMVKAIVSNYENSHGQDHLHAVATSAIYVMTGVIAEIKEKMVENTTFNINMESHMLGIEQQQDQDQYKKGEKRHRWLSFLKPLLEVVAVVVEVAVVVAAAASGNVAGSIAMLAMFTMLDTKGGKGLELAMENGNVPPVVAKLVEALLVLAVTVVSGGAADLLVTGEEGAEAAGSALTDMGSEMTDLASSAGSDLEGDITEGGEEGSPKKERSLAKLLGSAGLMAGSSTLLQNNFVGSVVKDMNSKALKDSIGLIIILLELVGAVAGGGITLSAGNDTEGLGYALKKLSTLTDGAIGGGLQATQEFAQTVSRIAGFVGATGMVVEGGLSLDSGVNKGLLAKAMEQVELINGAQTMTRDMLQGSIQDLKQTLDSFTQLFENFDFTAPADEMAQLIS